MYAETGLMLPYFQNFYQEIQPFDDLCYSQEPSSSSLDSLITSSAISDYDLGSEGDLFKAAEPIIEEPMMQLDPIMTATLAMMSTEDDVLSSTGLKSTDMESIQNEKLFCDMFDGFRKELLEKTSTETTVSDVTDIKLPLTVTNEVEIEKNITLPDLRLSKSGSSGSLSSMEWISGANGRPNFLDFPEMDFQTGIGMRRAFSEGDMKTVLIGNCTSEDRLQKLSRYRNKKSKRNFGRKIKYACRKALADTQPRVRGRFAKTEDTDSCKKH